jgi:hypothetical protein
MKTTATKTTAKKVQTENKINSDVEQILNSKNLMNDESLLNLDLESLDDFNLEAILNKVAPTAKQNKVSKESLYKNNPDKKQRQKLRNERNKFINNILFNEHQKNVNEVQKYVNEFQIFYLENYILNDYSELSICQNNSDNETKIKVKLFLKIIKKYISNTK